MTYDPKLIRGDQVIKKDGTISLDADWDIGNNNLIFDKLQSRDSNGFSISDSTGNLLLSYDESDGGSIEFFGRTTEGERVTLMKITATKISFYYEGVEVANIGESGIRADATYS